MYNIPVVVLGRIAKGLLCIIRNITFNRYLDLSTYAPRVPLLSYEREPWSEQELAKFNAISRSTGDFTGNSLERSAELYDREKSLEDTLGFVKAYHEKLGPQLKNVTANIWYGRNITKVEFERKGEIIERVKINVKKDPQRLAKGLEDAVRSCGYNITGINMTRGYPDTRDKEIIRRWGESLGVYKRQELKILTMTLDYTNDIHYIIKDGDEVIEKGRTKNIRYLITLRKKLVGSVLKELEIKGKAEPKELSDLAGWLGTMQVQKNRGRTPKYQEGLSEGDKQKLNKIRDVMRQELEAAEAAESRGVKKPDTANYIGFALRQFIKY